MYVNNINKNSLKSSSDHEILYFFLFIAFVKISMLFMRSGVAQVTQ